MIRVDKREPERIKEVIDWASQEGGRYWPIAIKSPKTLRKIFDNALIEMNHKSKEDIKQDATKAKEERINDNKIWLNQLLKTINFTNTSREIKPSDYCAQIKINSVVEPVSYNELNFKNIIENKLSSWGIYK